MSLSIKTVIGVFVILLCLSNSCENNKKEWTRIVVTKDMEGNFQWIKSYLRNDTIEHGLCKYYYWPNPKNVLKDEIEYKYGKREGLKKHYREDGTLETEMNFKNDKKDGLTFWYDKNHNIEQEESWLKGKQYGYVKKYFDNGQIEIFDIMDFSEQAMYVMVYDENGNKIKEEGLVISPNYIVVFADESTETPLVGKPVKAGKPFIIKLTAAEVPNTKTIVHMGEHNKGNMVEIPIENYTVNYKQTIMDTGIHSFKAIGEMYGLEHNNLLRRDSVMVNIEIVK